MSDFGTAPSPTQTPTPLFGNKLYDRLKYIALVILPALSALYFGLGEIWGLPKVTEVIGTIAVIDTVLGVLLRSSNQNYKKSDSRFDGTINKIEGEESTLYSLNLDGDPEKVLSEKDEILFKVRDVPSQDARD